MTCFSQVGGAIATRRDAIEHDKTTLVSRSSRNKDAIIAHRAPPADLKAFP
jgi:hypothetical protein